MKYIFTLFALSILLFSCRKDNSKGGHTPMPPEDIRDKQVGLYLPVYFGSRWVYNQYRQTGPQKQFIGIQTCRYDSIPDIFFNYDNDNKFLSYGLWYRYSMNQFLSGGGQLLLTDQYIDSLQGVPYKTNVTGYSKNYIYGGLETIQTKFGPVACLKTSGTSGTNGGNYWFRYFGYQIGVVKEEEYSIKNMDTIDHYILELDSYKINR